MDLWVLPTTCDRKPIPFLQTEFNETNGQFSPDGRWIAYQSDESSRYQVYVQSFPAGSGKWQISTDGGILPRWRRDGRELYYLSAGGKMMAVEVKPGPTFQAGPPKELFDTTLRGVTGHYAAAADGQRFLVIVPAEGAASEPLTVVLNWAAGVKK